MLVRVKAQWTLRVNQVPSCTSMSVTVTGRLPSLTTFFLSTQGFCLCEARPLGGFRLSCPRQHTQEPVNWTGGKTRGSVRVCVESPRACLASVPPNTDSGSTKLSGVGGSRGHLLTPFPCLFALLETRACGPEEGAVLQGCSQHLTDCSGIGVGG